MAKIDIQNKLPPLKEIHWDLDRVFIAFNKFAFVHDILMKDYNNNIDEAAKAIKIPTNYLRDLLYTDKRQAGTKTLTAIYRFCIRTGRPPENYIFIVQDIPPWLINDGEGEEMKEGDNAVWTLKNL